MSKYQSTIGRISKLSELPFLLLFATPSFSHHLYYYLLGQSTDSGPQFVRLVFVSCYSLLIYIPLALLISLCLGSRSYILVYLFSLFIATCELFYLVLYDAPLGAATFFVIFETSFVESSHYLASYSSVFGAIAPHLIFQILILFILILNSSNQRQNILGRWAAVVWIMLLAPVTNSEGRDSLRENLYLKMSMAYHEYREKHEKVQAVVKREIDELEPVSVDKPYDGKETYVLVIGESTGRNHLGLYGYHRNTTPLLQQMLPQLFVFTNVVSPDSHTIPVMKKVLTFANSEDEKTFFTKGSLIQYIQKAGFETYWISNQEPIGRYDTFVTVLASSCDHLLFLDHDLMDARQSYDERVLLPLENILRDRPPKKFIFVHLIGNHLDYCTRYPPQFSRFKRKLPGLSEKESEVVNCYDNTVLYGDYVISEIVKRVKQKEHSSFVLYFSDHGEDVYDTGDFFGHDLYQGTRFMYEVPFLLWLSDEYVRLNQEQVRLYNDYLSRKYMTDDLIHSLFDLMNLSLDSYVSRRSLFSKNFQPKDRLVLNRNYDTEIVAVKTLSALKKDVFQRQSKDFRERVWAHRVNSIGKLREVIQIFQGLELYIVWLPEQKTFDVNHPPAKSIGLTLEKYLDSIEQPNRYRYWLDLKNLAEDNFEDVLERLKTLSDKFGLRRQDVIVESSRPVLLRELKEVNFYTSYYLPASFVWRVTNKKSTTLSEEEVSTLKTIRNKIAISEIDAVSTYAGGYDFVTKYLPQDKAILLWDTSAEHHQTLGLLTIQRVLKDERVQVFLVASKSRYDR